MKIRFWDRLILFFGALLTLLAGAFLVVTGLQFLGVIGEALPVWGRVVCIAGGAVLALFGVYLFALPRKFTYRKHDFVVQQTDNGELRISVKAIENLVQKCIDMHEEIHVVSMKIRNNREGVTVDLCISLANNISIPLAVASLQKQIKQYLVASSGIDVKEVRVSVETAQTGVGDSPYLVPAEPGQAQEKPAEQPKAKLPLHQRIFSMADQPATMPEPPKAEDAPPPEEAEESEPDRDTPEEITPPEEITQEAEQEDGDRE